MFAKEVKAFIHRNRVADVVDALNTAGFRNITVVDVQGMLKALSSKEQSYSVEIGQKVVNEIKLELVCDNESRLAEAVAAIRDNAKTGQSSAGWIFVSDIRTVIEITE
ncbi:MAG: P-II family nitrogen regulator [Gammaproteobacteria bacterium]|jgi:nitrogen regulatory protein P-II 1|nr:P-II family nitrogen regulator [Gammaproteobacteria bacterium]